MRRRDFITGIGGSAVLWPLAARAQSERVRRIGVLVNRAEDTPDAHARLNSFKQGLEQHRWSEGHNIRLDIRYGNSRPELYQAHAKELVASQPDIIFAHTTPVVAALKRETSTIPIVFVSVSDPIGSGFITSMARPGGNVTGLMLYEAGITGKWLSMLKEIAPLLARAALIANPNTTPIDYYVGSAKAITASMGIEVIPRPVASAADIEQTVADIGKIPNSGLVVLPSATILEHRELFVALAARHRVPAVYPIRDFITAGGLMAYSTDLVDQSRQAATYIDRILRGAKPADLPVQAPTKYETILNLRTAKSLGLEVPSSLLVRADEVIE